MTEPTSGWPGLSSTPIPAAGNNTAAPASGLPPTPGGPSTEEESRNRLAPIPATTATPKEGREGECSTPHEGSVSNRYGAVWRVKATPRNVLPAGSKRRSQARLLRRAARRQRPPGQDHSSRRLRWAHANRSPQGEKPGWQKLPAGSLHAARPSGENAKSLLPGTTLCGFTHAVHYTMRKEELNKAVG